MNTATEILNQMWRNALRHTVVFAIFCASVWFITANADMHRTVDPNMHNNVKAQKWQEWKP